jgi:hypothetical protein
MGVVRERLSPLYMEDEDNGLHFADVRALAAVSPGLTVVEPCDERLLSNASFVITASTVVELFAPQASFVICVSMRSSSATIDPYSGGVLLDRSVGCVAALIRSLSMPYSFPWGHVAGAPTLQTTVHMTVVAEGGTGWDSSRTIVHAVPLPMAKEEMERLICVVGERLRQFESIVSAASTINGDLGFGLRTAAFMMGHMPAAMRQSIVVVADGVAAAPDLSVYDSPLMLMNRRGITCHVIQTTPFQPFQALGCVPSCESLQHLVRVLWFAE